jgi:hypothetical protein
MLFRYNSSQYGHHTFVASYNMCLLIKPSSDIRLFYIRLDSFASTPTLASVYILQRRYS